jgi:hypothetical protein
MDVFIPDTTNPVARRLARQFVRRGHSVTHCRNEGQASACAVVENRPCPLRDGLVDVAVSVGAPPSGQRGDGATCAATRRVPLVLVDPDPGDPLVKLAAATVVETEAVLQAEEVAARPLEVHTSVAIEVVARELQRLGVRGADMAVEVRRNCGSLVIELWRPPELPRAEAERIGTHVVQAVREHDIWARGVDVVVHEPRT